MTEQEYKEKLAVREQLSQFDRLRLLEFEFNKLIASIPKNQLQKAGIIRTDDSTAAVLDSPNQSADGFLD